jgi:polar amino acid transport system substrate-binding protein
LLLPGRDDMIKTLGWKLLAVLLLLGPVVPARSTETIPLYSYYVDLPFASGPPGSVTDKLAHWLTQRSGGRYHFVPTQLPRRRIELLVQQPNWPGVVAWANPRWFSDERLSWSRNYMLDANLVVSPLAQPLDYSDDGALAGQSIGTVRGFSYTGIDELIQSGKLTRDDADSELRNLARLKAGRLQVAFLQASSLRYFREQYPDLDQWLYIAAKPRTLFERAFFTASGRPELLAFLNQQADALVADRQWQALLGTCKQLMPRLAAPTEAQRRLCR